MELHLTFTVYVGSRLAYTSSSCRAALAQARKLFHSHTLVTVRSGNKLVQILRR